jgi:hypothetical protein
VSLAERLLLHLSALLTVGTGLLYGWLRYFGQRAGEFGPEPHPAQAWLQHAHILVSPVLLFALGMLIRGHVQPMLRRPAPVGRRSGLVAVLVLAPMVLSGYGVQVVTEPGWRVGLAWLHGVFSLLFLAGYAAHLAKTRGRADEDLDLE